jgi:hypothetical protein
MSREELVRAGAIIDGYLARTGVVGRSGESDRRYLWTDAFAVRTLISLHDAMAERRRIDEAVLLANTVHRVLGRHRRDDARAGWISGLGEAEGELRPTAGGLRIGKPLPERPEAEPLDERLEWERDGQYFHYLTRWMEALCALSRATGDPAWSRMAVELGHAACHAFIYSPRAGARPRMHWKMSIDLRRPLVRSMGQLDPLEGLATLLRVRATAASLGIPTAPIEEGLARLGSIIGDGVESAPMWATIDPLGIGGLLAAAGELVDLTAAGAFDSLELVHMLLACAHRSLDHFAASDELSRPLESRLAFRELGLSLGVQAIEPMIESVKRRPMAFGGPAATRWMLERLDSIARFAPIGLHIERVWSDGAAQSTVPWRDHLDINEVMLAASLASSGSPLSAVRSGLGGLGQRFLERGDVLGTKLGA